MSYFDPLSVLARINDWAEEHLSGILALPILILNYLLCFTGFSIILVCAAFYSLFIYIILPPNKARKHLEKLGEEVQRAQDLLLQPQDRKH